MRVKSDGATLLDSLTSKAILASLNVVEARDRLEEGLDVRRPVQGGLCVFSLRGMELDQLNEDPKAGASQCGQNRLELERDLNKVYRASTTAIAGGLRRGSCNDGKRRQAKERRTAKWANRQFPCIFGRFAPAVPLPLYNGDRFFPDPRP